MKGGVRVLGRGVRTVRRGFLAAIAFLTRMPVPFYRFREGDLASATPYFPAVGLLIGGGAWLLFLLLQDFIPLHVLVLVLLACLVLATGAFHEDGFADFFDGMGGGHSKEDVLRIMKDSRLGTYGALALLFLMAARFLFLAETRLAAIPASVAAAAVLGRWAPLPLMKLLPYARSPRTSSLEKEALGWRRMPWGALLLSGLFSVSVAFFLLGAAALYSIAAVAMVSLAMGWYCRRRISGITGDCAGAVEQCAELAVLFTVMVSA